MPFLDQCILGRTQVCQEHWRTVVVRSTDGLWLLGALRIAAVPRVAWPARVPVPRGHFRAPELQNTEERGFACRGRAPRGWSPELAQPQLLPLQYQDKGHCLTGLTDEKE